MQMRKLRKLRKPQKTRKTRRLRKTRRSRKSCRIIQRGGEVVINGNNYSDDALKSRITTLMNMGGKLTGTTNMRGEINITNVPRLDELLNSNEEEIEFVYTPIDYREPLKFNRRDFTLNGFITAIKNKMKEYEHGIKTPMIKLFKSGTPQRASTFGSIEQQIRANAGEYFMYQVQIN